MEIKDFKVGQKVWVKLTGNAVRGKSIDERIEEWEVISVGRNHVKAKKVGYSDCFGIKFEKEEHSYRFVQKTACIDYEIYESKQDILDEFEKNKLFAEISKLFRDFKSERKVILEKLREISKIIQGDYDN